MRYGTLKIEVTGKTVIEIMNIISVRSTLDTKVSTYTDWDVTECKKRDYLVLINCMVN